MSERLSDSLGDISAALDANPFADPVWFRGWPMPRAKARELERHLIAVRRDAKNRRAA